MPADGSFEEKISTNFVYQDASTYVLQARSRVFLALFLTLSECTVRIRRYLGCFVLSLAGGGVWLSLEESSESRNYAGTEMRWKSGI